jgi:hypothetical protein
VKALRRFLLLRRVLESMGIEPARFQRFYASAAEGQQLADAFERIVEEVRALGPLDWAGRHAVYVVPAVGDAPPMSAAEAAPAQAPAPPAERELAEVTA